MIRAYSVVCIRARTEMRNSPRSSCTAMGAEAHQGLALAIPGLLGQQGSAPGWHTILQRRQALDEGVWVKGKLIQVIVPVLVLVDWHCC